MNAARVRRVTRWAVFVLVQVVVVGFLAEAVLRLVGPHLSALRAVLYSSTAVTDYERCRTLPELLETSILGFVPCTESYGFVLNTRGLRTSEYTIEKRPGSCRVLVFGDSFAYASGGLPHREHWPTLLEGLLAKRWAGDVDVLRFGVPGTGTQFQLRLWQLEGTRLDADLVVLGFFIGNDLFDERGAGGIVSLRASVYEWLVENSFTVRAIRNLVRLSGAVEGPGPIATGAKGTAGACGQEMPQYGANFPGEQPTFSEDQFLAIEARRMSLCLRTEQSRRDRLVAAAASSLRWFRDEVQAADARLLVLLIPDEYQVEEPLAAAVARRARRDLGDYDLQAPQRDLVRHLTEAAIEHLDLLPAFTEQARQAPLYRPRDTHWNQAGNLLAAQVLADYLAVNSLPCAPPVRVPVELLPYTLR